MERSECVQCTVKPTGIHILLSRTAVAVKHTVSVRAGGRQASYTSIHHFKLTGDPTSESITILDGVNKGYDTEHWKTV